VDPYSVGVITTVWDWLNQVNAANFAGHSDWRLPSEVGCNSCYAASSCLCSSHELETLLLAPYPCSTSPCIDSIFGPTASSRYWSASTVVINPDQYRYDAWDVDFGVGSVVGDYKIAGDYNHYVRAVR